MSASTHSQLQFPRSSGVLLHPTSLPGPHGSGDFGADAYRFVDWLASAGQRLWQILPLGGIGPGNSPYMSSSAFAGNVLLIDLDELRQRGWLSASDVEPVAGLSPRRVDFGVVVPFRMERLARAAARFAANASTADRASLDAFCAGHASWLDDYALFMALADHHGWRDWSDWPSQLAFRDPAALAVACGEHAARIAFWKFCQWCFFRQWLALRAHANDRGVQVVGDAPIFIAYQSAEVWARPDLFELDAKGKPTVIAGVPPDFFSATGQRWGNPLYRWSAHARDGHAWWIERVRRTFELVDIVRIDHFRGFAGYWEIPAGEPTAENGRWLPGPGPALFDALHAAIGRMPIIAEDLGLITPDVDALRKQFGFPGMRILQFAFDAGSGNHFLPHNHASDTVVYTGTHDNDTTVGWWDKASAHERRHVADYLQTDGHEIHWDLIRAACASVGDMAVHPMQDVLGLGGEHRMNYPGKSEGYWEWRFGWDQVRPEQAERLRTLCALYRRDGTAPERAVG
ncbi:MAG TPA: 4-alpha-glucanotransferase [Albitalea sp.]|uniref:4-alpha-glucanotransferase n=1 Tax=Piscinibacter sp. TaxID=1903157 RepID=UPI002ED4BFAE